MTEERVKEFKKNGSLEDLLKDINDNLESVETKLAIERKQEYPIIFVMGPLRSGTTLMLQWLASTGQIAYPTNMLSRFYGAPIMGAKIQKLLTDERYNFRNEIMDFHSKQDYKSENGKTKGALSPNEFWYFWRKYLDYESEIEYIEDEKLFSQEKLKQLKRELVGVTEEFEKPFALKGMICNYNIPFLDQLFDKSLFVYTKRNPYDNIESILKARERQFGTIDEWYSFKIPEYPELIKHSNPVKQVAGQVYYNNKAVLKGLDCVSEERKLIVEYEDFCDNPEKYYKMLVDKLAAQGCEIKAEYTGEKQFRVTRTSDNSEIVECYDEYVKERMYNG